MLRLVPGRLNAEISAWHIKLNTMKLRVGKFAFFLYCTITQQYRKNSHLVDAALLDAARLKKNGSRLLDFSLSTVL